MATSSPNWQAVLAAYESGAGDSEIARLLKITLNRFYQLMDESEAFAELVDRGRTFGRAWWEEQGRINLFNKDFNVSLWNFNMKNRYGWADKVDTNDTTEKDPVNLDQAKAQLTQALKTVAKKNPEILRALNVNPDGT